MINNNNFKTKWHKNHKKGVFKYWIDFALPLSIVTMSSMLLFSYINNAFDRISDLFKYNLFFNLLFNLLILGTWFISDKKTKMKF